MAEKSEAEKLICQFYRARTLDHEGDLMSAIRWYELAGRTALGIAAQCFSEMSQLAARLEDTPDDEPEGGE